MRLFWFVPTVVILCAVVEAFLTLSDLRVLPFGLRQFAYSFGGFWPGLLADWRPNYPAQPMVMFVTYGFLHGGPVHLVVNMLTLWSLGRAIADRAGQWVLALIYVVSLLAGGVGFGVLASSLDPMVGASGALFGLAGALILWEFLNRLAHEMPIWPVLRVVGLLVLVNVVLWWALDGLLAWETHLGGFLGGLISGYFCRRFALETYRIR